MPASDQGVFHQRYKLIPRTLVFLTRGDRVLLLRGAPDKPLWADLYNGVGGHVERGEDVLSAARREVREETGLNVDGLWLCATVTVDTGQDTGIAIFVLRGECPRGECKPRASREGSLEWVATDRISELPLVEDLHDLLPRLLSRQPGDPPLSAHYSYDAEDRLVVSFAD